MDDKNPVDPKRLAIFLLASVLVMVAWTWVFPPETPPPPVEPEAPASGAASPGGPIEQPETPEPLPAAPEARAESSARREVVEVDGARIEFTNVGGRITSWVLSDHGEYGAPDLPLDLVQHEVPSTSADMPSSARLVDGQARTLPPVDDAAPMLPLQVLTGTPALDARLAGALHEIETVAQGETTLVHLRWSDGAGTAVEKKLTFRRGEPLVTVEAHVVVEGRPTRFHLGWGPGIGNHTENDFSNSYFVRGRVAWRAGGEVEQEGQPEDAADLPGARVDWAALEESFFAAMFVPAIPGEPNARCLDRGYELRGVLPPKAEGKAGSTKYWPEHLVLAAPFAPEAPFQSLFVGPRSRELLAAVDARLPGARRLDELTHLGFVDPIAAVMHRIMVWLYEHTLSWGAAILLLTLVIRAVMFPFTHVSLKKMRVLQQKMQHVKPRMDSIRTKYRKMPRSMENRQREQQELMALYQQAGIQPADQLMGCLPMLLSLPFFWALFRLLPQAIEFRHEPFLYFWKDLSAADPTHVWPLMTAGTMYLSSRLNLTSTTNVDPMQKNMLYVFPLMFAWITWSAPLGLVVYWTASTVIQIGQQYLLKLTLPQEETGDATGKHASSAKKKAGKAQPATATTGAVVDGGPPTSRRKKKRRKR